MKLKVGFGVDEDAAATRLVYSKGALFWLLVDRRLRQRLPRRQPSRQEPLFSSSAMKRPDLSTRAEPVLRPRPQRSEDDA